MGSLEWNSLDNPMAVMGCVTLLQLSKMLKVRKLLRLRLMLRPDMQLKGWLQPMQNLKGTEIRVWKVRMKLVHQTMRRRPTVSIHHHPPSNPLTVP
jgi:hypothetical protein